jgi:glycosyltransferase involved in cell wall biosynthesis
MIIGIDGNEANVEKRVGIGEYAFQLLWQLERRKSQEVRHTFMIYLKDKPLSHLPAESKQWQYRVFGPKKLWTQWRLPLDLYTHFPRPDVFFSPTHYAPRFSPVPTVVSIMDLSYLRFPELFAKKDLVQLKQWTDYSVRKATKILTISNASKNDIINAYGVDPSCVVVTHLGIKTTISLTPHIYSMNELRMKYGVSDQFILFVGTLQPRKNITRLIEAFHRVITSSNQEDKLQLIIVGKRGWLYDEILAKPKELGIEDRVKFLENVNDEELHLFYKHALCYVLPSLYEGFGLPVLEAMQQGCPVITSNVSSLPEAGGDAALYVNPEDVSDITKKIKDVITDEKLRKQLREKGFEQVKKFSWEKTAQETLKVLEEVGNKK